MSAKIGNTAIPLALIAPSFTFSSSTTPDFKIASTTGGNPLGGQLGGLAISVLSNALAGAIGGNGDSGMITSSILSNFGATVGNSMLNGSTFSQGLKDFGNIGNLGNLGGSIASSLLDSHTTHLRTSGKYGGIASAVDASSGIIGLAFGNNPYGMVGQVGMSAINKITGGTDGMTVADSLLGSSGMAGALFAVNPWVGAGYMALSGINSATGKTTTKNANNDFFSKLLLDTVWGSYGKSNKDHLNALKYGNKKYGGLSVLAGSFDKANNKVMEDNTRTNTLMRIANTQEIANIRGNNMADINNLAYLLSTAGGYDQKYNRIGRKGMKLPTKQDITKVRAILSRKSGGNLLPPKPEFYSILAEFDDQIPEFKEGGTIIPEGALHKCKNHMEGAGKDFTHKGIPVVDNSGEQQAEIECNEIIFSLEVTKRLEQLMEDGSDKAAIAAGKLLVKEIFENTEDRTGLISSIIGEDSEGDDIEELSKLEEGGTVEIAKEGTKTLRKRKYDTPWKFMNYINSTGRGLSDDYDYESFYNNEDAYFKWEDEEESNPGKAHMSGDFKKPNHITYSDEGFGWKGSDELGWTFTVSPRLQSLRSYEDYIKYWDANEPESTLIYGDKTYKVKK